MTARHYLGIAEQSADGWSISFPAFPGTVTTGDTFAALMAHAPNALASVIEALREDSAAIPAAFDEAAGDASSFDAALYQNPRVVRVSVEISGN